jgi:hypothetical protein
VEGELTPRFSKNEFVERNANMGIMSLSEMLSSYFWFKGKI